MLVWLLSSFLLLFLGVICCLRFKDFVSFMKYIFIILPIYSSLLIMLFSSTKVIFEELDVFSLKDCLAVFQKSLFFETCFIFKLLKYCFFVFLKIFKQKAHWRSKLHQFLLLLSVLYLFFILDRSIIISIITMS